MDNRELLEIAEKAVEDMSLEDISEEEFGYEGVTGEYDVSDYPYDIENVRTDYGDVTLVGVDHNQPFFSEYWPLFEEKVGENQGVMVESPGDSCFYDGGFYAEIGWFAMQDDKPVYVADPEVVLDSKKETVIASGILGGFGLAAASLVYGGGSLRELGALAGLSFMYSGTLPGRRMIFDSGNDGFSRYTVGFTDYRDVMVADGIEKVLVEEDIKSIVNFMGAGHTESIKHYLENPDYRRFKRGLYYPLRFFDRDGVLKYRPRSLSTDWEIEYVIE